MSVTICLSANTFYYPEGGGHMWVYLNWALGFMQNGCRVIWLEEIKSSVSPEKNSELIASLKERLRPFDLDNCIALWRENQSLSKDHLFGCIPVEEAAYQSDLLLNQDYVMPAAVIDLFKRSALLDIDPGLLQTWIYNKAIKVAEHVYYFTIGETVGKTNGIIPDCGLPWIYTPPCVSLTHWPVTSAPGIDPFTTITHWTGNGWEEINGEPYDNNKRACFLPFIKLPAHSPVTLKLAILLSTSEEEDRIALQKNGWILIQNHFFQQMHCIFKIMKP